MEQYKDKHGKVIKAGMYVKHDDGDVEEVYGAGDELGISATNPDYARNQGNEGAVLEIYPFHQFDLKEWKIIDKPK